MKNVLIALVAIVAVTAHAKQQSREDIAKCAQRIQNDCKISNNDEKRIKENGVACKQVQGFGETMEAVVLESGDVTIISNNCRITKYDLGRGLHIEDLKVIQGRAYMSTGAGAAYYFRADRSGSPIFYEVLNSSRRSYSGVDSFKGNQNGTAVKFIDKSGNPMQIVDGQTEISAEEIERLSAKGRLRQVPFVYAPADRSLFRN